MTSGRPTEAEPHLKIVAETGSPEATFQLADYYVATKRLPDAIHVLEPLAKDPKNAAEAESRLATIAYAQNDGPRAHALIDGVLKREPANVPALLLKATFLKTEQKYPEALERAQAAHQPSAAGVFGADMHVSLVNDGPVTFWLETPAANVAD